MTKAFEKKLLYLEIVDTKNYRYMVKTVDDRREIYRIKINLLNTTAVYSEWEFVKVIR